MYSLGNSSQCFELRTKLKDIKQGENSVTQYFSDLQDIWQELDLFLEDSSVCSTCCIKARKSLEKERVFDFLAGLNLNLDEVRGRVVARDPFPSPEDAFAEVRREEMRPKVMFSDETSSQHSIPDVSALVTQKLPPTAPRMSERPWCDHYKRPGHTKDKCWKIHGKPTNWQPRKKSDAYMVQPPIAHMVQPPIAPDVPGQSGTTKPFTKDQIEQIEQYCQ